MFPKELKEVPLVVSACLKRPWLIASACGFARCVATIRFWSWHYFKLTLQ